VPSIRHYWTELLVAIFALTLGAFGQRVFQPLGPPAQAVVSPGPVWIDPYLAQRLGTVPERLSSLETAITDLGRRIDQLENDRRADAKRAQ